MNHFETMLIESIVLNLNADFLESRFYELSKQFHPDRAGGSSAALEKSAAINGAYRVLRDPWSRAHYVLKLYSISLGSKVPPCLAPIYFELQETADRGALAELRETLLKGKKLRDHQLVEIFKKFDEQGVTVIETPPPAELQKVLSMMHDLVLENNYAQSMLRDLEAKLG